MIHMQRDFAVKQVIFAGKVTKLLLEGCFAGRVTNLHNFMVDYHLQKFNM